MFASTRTQLRAPIHTYYITVLVSRVYCRPYVPAHDETGIITAQGKASREKKTTKKPKTDCPRDAPAHILEGLVGFACIIHSWCLTP